MKKKKKKDMRKKINDNRKYFIIGVVVILAIIIVLYVINSLSRGIADPYEGIFDKAGPEVSPLELSQQKESLEGKTITVQGVLIPSEAFIYVSETKDKIYLNPPNMNHCKNYDLTGVLLNNLVKDRWEFIVENYDNCLD